MVIRDRLLREPARRPVRPTGMIGHMQRWWVPALAAVAVLAVIVAIGLGVLGSPDVDRGSDVADGGSDSGAGAPPYDGTEPGDPGSAPGDAPGDPGEVPPADGPGAEPGRPADPGMIALDSFYSYDARHLALNYYNGVPECYGEAGEPRVEEHDDRVLVAVPRTPPTAAKGTACIEIALAGSVKVRLSAPLGDRAVVDTATGRQLREAASPHDEQQAS